MSEIPLARTMRDGDRALSSDAPAWNRTVDHAGPPVEHLQVQTDRPGRRTLSDVHSLCFLFLSRPGRAGPGQAEKGTKTDQNRRAEIGLFQCGNPGGRNGRSGRAGSGRVGPGRFHFSNTLSTTRSRSARAISSWRTAADLAPGALQPTDRRSFWAAAIPLSIPASVFLLRQT